ncbi:Uncharacterised protein [Mycobacteroides abscessus subsp. abscessus]|nr:Uncharacterised protein [Mycobacteroides abscessus subsp. abscessus]
MPTTTASAITVLSRSAAHRPATTAALLIGRERNRSVTPLAASAATAAMVDSSPNSMVIANMPGIRYS